MTTSNQIDNENTANSTTTAPDFPPLPTKPTFNAVIGDDTRGPAGTRIKTFSRVITLPVEEQRRPAMGEKLVPADIAKAVAKSLGVSVDMSSSVLTHTITMVVKGQDERKVVEACRGLRARLALSVKVVVAVPARTIGVIVGKQGRSIKTIMQETGARIIVPNSNNSGDTDRQGPIELTIEGPGEACAQAKKRILTIVDEAVSQVVEKVDLVGHSEFFLCGPAHNRTIKLLQSEFEHIKVSHVPGRIMLSGDTKLVNLAKEQLMERINKINREVKQISTNIPKNLHKYLVGSKGAVLHNIEDVTGCLVIIPPPEDVSDSISIYGMPSQLVTALQMLMEKTEAFHEEPIACPLVIRSYLQHKHNGDLRKIESEHSVSIKTEPTGFVAVGSKTNGEEAKSALKRLIQGLASLQFDTVTVRKGLVKHVIGRQGQGLKALEQEHGVNVIVEEEETAEETMLILVADSTDNVVKAREAVCTFLAQLDNQDTKDVSLNEKYVSDVLKHLKSIQDLHPSYSIAFSQKTKSVRIRGPKGVLFEDCLESVTQKIKQVEQYAEEHSFQASLIMTEKAKEQLSLKTLRSKLGLPADLTIELDNLRVTLKGRKSDVMAFEKRVDEYLSMLADKESVTLPIEEEMIGKLIGKGGKNIAVISSHHPLVNIRFDRENETAIMTGPSAAVQKCAAELSKRIVEISKTSHHTMMKVSVNAINRLLSKQAEELGNLQKGHNVRISIDHESSLDDGMKTVKIEGSIDDIEACTLKMKQIELEEYEESVSLSTDQSQLLQHSFQSYFRQFTSSLQGVRVIKSNESIRIRGTPQVVANAKERIQQFLNDLQDDTVMSVQVVCIEQRYHGAIIGQRGQNVKKLMSTFDVSIDISKESNEVTVAGRGVAGCIDEIMKLVN